MIAEIGVRNAMQQEEITIQVVLMRERKAITGIHQVQAMECQHLGAIMCVVGGFVGGAFLFTLLDVDVDSVPTFILVILIIVVTSVIAGVISAFKGK